MHSLDLANYGPVIPVIVLDRIEDAVPMAQALVAGGLRVLEVTLRTPAALHCMEAIALAVPEAIVGAGTVLSVADVDAVKAAGGQFIVSPNVNRDVILRSFELGLEALPGFMTPTEAFAAIEAGARLLKLFPAATLGSGYLKAIGAVLPRHVKVIAVGGIGPSAMAEWQAAGASGFGLGSELYRPGLSAAEVSEKTAACVAALGR